MKTGANIDKEGNIVSDSHYWKKNGDNYIAYPRTTSTSGFTSSAVLQQNIAGVEKTWHIITPGLAVSENVSENGGDFRKATKRFGQNKLRAITRQGWIFNQENKVWTGEKWETLLELLGPSYTHAELLSGGNRLAINDEGLAIAKIQKAGQPMKIGLLLPVEFEIIHIEKERDHDGNEIQSVVKPGKDTILRDEIVDIRIKVPPIGITERTIDLTIEPESMRSQLLPVRGSVKMYDFGQIDDKGTASQDDDKVTPDKTQFVLQASAGGERTIRAVFNKEGKLNINMDSSDGKVDFTSPEYSIKTRVRKYCTPYLSFPTHDPNKYDQQFVDAAKHWGDFYSHTIDTVDRLKAIAVAESNVGAQVQNKTSRPHDILTIGHPDDDVLETIQGNPKQWDLDLNHPKMPAADSRYKILNYPEANIGSTREAIKWGVLWLYVKGFGLSVNIQANPNWTYPKRNQAPFNLIDGIEEPEYRFTSWSSWDFATEKYNGGRV